MAQEEPFLCETRIKSEQHFTQNLILSLEMFSEHCFCEKHKFQSNPKNFMQKIKNLFPLEINKLYIKAAHFGLEM